MNPDDVYVISLKEIIQVFLINFDDFTMSIMKSLMTDKAVEKF